MPGFWHDVRQAARTLARDRTFAVVAILTLGFGIAVNTVIFSIVDAILLRPLAFRDPGQLVAISEVVPELSRQYPHLPVNARHFFEWRERCTAFQDVALLHVTDFVLTRAGQPERLHGARVSANFLDLLGVHPQLGRGFTANDDQPGRNDVVIISDSLWARRFHRDPRLIGRTITLDGSPRTVAGILPASFRLPRSQQEGMIRATFPVRSDVFQPAGFRREQLPWLGEFNHSALARLRPGVSLAQASAAMDALQASIATNFSQKLQLRALLMPLQDDVTGGVRKGLLILFAAVGAVLLIVCVNLANLTLARATGHSRDLAIRVALGASRGRLVRHILAESLCLGAAGGALGIALAWAGLAAVLRYAPLDLPRLEEIHLDPRALLFAVALAALTALLCGILPAWRASLADPQQALRAGSRTATHAREGRFTRNLLVGCETGLSAALLIVAGLLLASFVKLLSVEKGFDAGRLIAMEINLPGASYRDGKAREPYYRRLVEKLQSLPGVTSAGLVSHMPLQGEDWVDALHRPGEPLTFASMRPANYRFCTPDYFRAMGIPIVAGSSFTEADRQRNPALISEATARAAWPNENPLGKRFDRGNSNESPFEVVGVVRDVSTGLTKKPVLAVYVPYWYRSRLHMNAVVRTAADPRAIASSLRSAVWSVDPDTVVGEIRTMENVVSTSVGQRRFQVELIAGFAVAALLLASLGIYGVVSWSVQRRRNEIGIRMALGASGSAVNRMVVAEGLRPVVLGLAAGVAAALAGGGLLESLLFGVSPRDPATIAAVAVLLTAVAALACWIPVRRATTADPLEALRYE